MSPFKDLLRVVIGVSLVAREAAKRSEALTAARKGDLETLITKTLKSAVVTATDLAGFTKGKPREISNPNNNNNNKPNESSVVYFYEPPAPEPESKPVSRSDPIEEAAPAPQQQQVSVRERDDEGRGIPFSSELGDAGGKIEIENEKDVNLVNLKNEKKSDGGGGSGSEQVVVPLKGRRPRERRVPSTPLTRFMGFAGLGAGLAWGTVQESAKRIVYGTPSTADEKQSALSPFLSDQNAERLALGLCRMRGAALKLGQMLSIQDESLVPAPILAALEIVRQGADVMPRSQLNDVLDAELGPDWKSKLRSFDYEPLAAASIGQVHLAVMKDGLEVAMKIQYPGVADSIDSDIENVRRLLNYTNLIPKGLFLDSAIKVAKVELARECDYILEAKNQKRFCELLSNSEGFYVPIVIDEISSRKVLTTELVAD